MIEGQWEGDCAAGFPNAENPNADMTKNPHFLIHQGSAGKGFAVLRLKEKENAYRAHHYGYLLVQSNDGRLIDGPRQNKNLISIGPKNAAVNSAEFEFPTSLSYPYKFTAVVSNKFKGEKGHGGFSIQIFSKD